MTPHTPATPLDDLLTTLRMQGFAVLDAAATHRLADGGLGDLAALAPSWHDLPADTYLRDGGAYRRRRHASFVVDGTGVRRVAHRAHWQPLDYNALHGGLERWFAPMSTDDTECPAWAGLLCALAGVASALKGTQPWYVEAHQFRIDTANGIGRPTPEGAHRDGVDLVAVVLVARQAIKGGETRVFAADGPLGVRFTLDEPWSMLLLDDERVIHETTPIQPLEAINAAAGHRDTLVLTLRAGGFQDPVR